MFLFNVRHQIVTLRNTICHLGVFVFLYPSDLKVELMVFLFLIAALDHCSFASLKASLVSLGYITLYLSFCEFIFLSLICLDGLVNIFLTCFGILDINSSW